MDEKQVRKVRKWQFVWQFVGDNSEIVNGQVEMDDQSKEKNTMDEKQVRKVRKWQFVDDNSEIVNGQVEMDDQSYEALQSGMSESERRRISDHYDRLAKWRSHHPFADEKE